MREPEPLQARKREQGGVDLSGIELAQPGLHIAAQGPDFQIGTPPLHLRLPPQGRGADAGAARQVGERLCRAADEDIARILALKAGSQHQPLRQNRRHVFRRMNGEVDLARQQRLLDLLGKERLAPRLRQRSILNAVPGGSDAAQLDVGGIKTVRGHELRTNGSCLGECQRRAARADAQDARGFQGLRHWTPQCYAGLR